MTPRPVSDRGNDGGVGQKNLSVIVYSFLHIYVCMYISSERSIIYHWWFVVFGSCVEECGIWKKAESSGSSDSAGKYSSKEKKNRSNEKNWSFSVSLWACLTIHVICFCASSLKKFSGSDIVSFAYRIKTNYRMWLLVSAVSIVWVQCLDIDTLTKCFYSFPPIAIKGEIKSDLPNGKRPFGCAVAICRN